MDTTFDTQYFFDIEKALKPHPKYEGMRWAVFGGQNMTAVVLEIDPVKQRLRDNPPPNPFTGGNGHFHSDLEQISFFLGSTSDCPDDIKTKSIQTLSNTSNERGLTGSGVIVWLPRYIVHDIPIPKDEEEAFMQEFYPDGYPEGMKYMVMDMFSPPRPEYVEYFRNQPDHF